MKMESQRILCIDAPVGRHQSRCDAGCTPHGPDAFGYHAGLWRLSAACVMRPLLSCRTASAGSPKRETTLRLRAASVTKGPLGGGSVWRTNGS